MPDGASIWHINEKFFRYFPHDGNEDGPEGVQLIDQLGLIFRSSVEYMGKGLGY